MPFKDIVGHILGKFLTFIQYFKIHSLVIESLFIVGFGISVL